MYKILSTYSIYELKNFVIQNQKQLQELLVNTTIRVMSYEESYRGPFELEELQVVSVFTVYRHKCKNKSVFTLVYRHKCFFTVSVQCQPRVHHLRVCNRQYTP